MAAEVVLLHGLAAPSGRELEGVVQRLTGPPELLARAAEGLPEGPARAEAVAARLRLQGVRLERGEPDATAGVAGLVELSRERGASAVLVARADPSLLPQLQVGSWFLAPRRLRALRRAFAAAGAGAVRGRSPELAADLSFWAGVRAAATPREWRRLTRSSYTVLLYHRLAGLGRPGEERIDVDPKRFEAHLRLLRRLRFHPLSPEELLAFHRDADAVLPARAYVLTFDDAFADAAAALAGKGPVRPQVFVPTALAGRPAPWAHGAPLAGWAELQALAAAGIAVGSHTRSHAVLPELDPQALEEELAGSLRELAQRLPAPLPVLAYPHGRHDRTVAAAAAAAGYAAAFTTEPGRTGAGTDPFQLRRVSVKDWDASASLLWKASTGEQLPPAWERWRRLVHRRRGRG